MGKEDGLGKIPSKTESEKFSEALKEAALKYDAEQTALVHIPSERRLKPTSDLIENLDIIPGDIVDFADAIESKVQFHQRELNALIEIHRRIKNSSVSDSETEADSQQKSNKNAVAEEIPEDISDVKVVVPSANPSVPANVKGSENIKAIKQPAIDLRRQIISKFLERKIFTGEPPREITGLLNYFVDDNNTDALEFINGCVEKTEPDVLLAQLTRIYENFELSESLNKQVVGDEEKKTKGLWSLGKVNLLDFITGDETSEEEVVIDWDGLAEVVELMPLPDPALVSDTAEKGQSNALSEKVSMQPALPALLKRFENTGLTSDRYEIQKALDAIYNSNNAVVIKPPEGEIFAIVGGWQKTLVDPKTGAKLSDEYVDITITPHEGLFRVTKELDGGHTGQGYIDYSGKVIIEPQLGSRVDRYHNGSEIIFDGRKAVNIKSGLVLHETDGGEEINVFGNLLAISVENRNGKEKWYDRRLLKSNGENLELGKIEEMEPVVTETQEIPYVGLGARRESTTICTRVSVKIEGKYGLVNALDGSVILKPEYKNIDRFYGGIKLGKLKMKKPVYNAKGELLGYDDLSLKIPIEYVLVQDEQERFYLLDQDMKRVLDRDFESREDLEKAFDEKFPDNLRKFIFL